MAGISHNCKIGRPCKICGKPDYCNWVEFSSGDTLEYCHRVSGEKGDTVQGKLGGLFRCKRVTQDGFYVWEPIEQYERNLKEFLQTNASTFKSGKGGHPKMAAVKHVEPLPIENVSPLAHPDRLNEVNRTFLSLLLLENRHALILREEWDKQPGLFDRIIARYPIRSIPPQDHVRISSGEPYQNRLRKQIMKELIQKVGIPEGVPYFYEGKNGEWTFDALSGICYPIYDSKGRIVRLRVADDHPKVEGKYQEKEGVYYYRKDEMGTGWYFAPLCGEQVDYSKRELVWSYKGDKKITLNQKGYPQGKVKGKYKNCTSFIEKRVRDEKGEHIVNLLNKGCQSGSHLSVYTKEGDDPAVVYATEGEKKALVANMLLNVPVISIPGVSSFGKLFMPEEGEKISLMDALRKKGMELTVLVYDADKNQNALVLKSEESAVKRFLSEGLKIAIGEWNPSWGKGLDDVLLTSVMPQIHLVK